jgi:hypothetical protein
VLAATLSWFAVEAVVQVIGTDNPGGFTRGEWLLLWRRVQMCLWFAFLVASQLVLIGPMRRRLEPSAA